jgi:hypothetical protein
MKTQVGDFYNDVYPVGSSIVESQARTDFKAARGYAISLIDIHDSHTGGTAGRPPTQLEALKRSSLILAVTAWESFIEDTVRQQLELKLSTAPNPSQISSIFNYAAHEWLESEGSKHRAPELAQWAGDSWKQIIRQSLITKLDKFHTPSTKNTNDIFKRFLNVSQISDSWAWQNSSSTTASRNLDELIQLRGRAVHVGLKFHPLSQQEPSIKRITVVKALNLIYNLVYATEQKLGNGPNPLPPPPPL